MLYIHEWNICFYGAKLKAKNRIYCWQFVLEILAFHGAYKISLLLFTVALVRFIYRCRRRCQREYVYVKRCVFWICCERCGSIIYGLSLVHVAMIYEETTRCEEGGRVMDVVVRYMALTRSEDYSSLVWYTIANAI